jgi:hypothetical protein
MTSVQSMLERKVATLVIALVGVGALGGCASNRLEEPVVLQTPYDGTKVWAAAPFTNESGVSVADGAKFADAFLAQTEQVDGLEAVPLNRTIAAMQLLGLDVVRTPADAKALLNMLNVDGLVVGTLTAYDPYPPLTLGASVALFTRDHGVDSLSPRELTLSTRGERTASSDQDRVTTASGVFDASNHRTLSWLKEFAHGRHVPDSAFGPAIYESSMTMYTEFVSYALIHDLLVREAARLTPPTGDPGKAGAPAGPSATVATR